VANDYCGILGVRKDADGDEIKKAYRRLARELHRTSIPTRRPGAVQEITQAYEVLSDPEKRQMYDLGADPFGPSARARAASGPGSRSATSWMRSSAPRRPQAAQPGPPRPQRHHQVELDLSECAFGTTKDLAVDTAVVCPTCSGEEPRLAPTRRPVTCAAGGEISQVTRSFLGQVMPPGRARSAAGTAR
jgi:molecular chaperone DnaJ